MAENNSNYGVINEQGFVVPGGFNKVDKKSDEALKKPKLEDKE